MQCAKCQEKKTHGYFYPASDTSHQELDFMVKLQT